MMHNQESDQVNTKISNSVSQLLKLNNNKGTVYLISGPKQYLKPVFNHESLILQDNNQSIKSPTIDVLSNGSIFDPQVNCFDFQNQFINMNPINSQITLNRIESLEPNNNLCKNVHTQHQKYSKLLNNLAIDNFKPQMSRTSFFDQIFTLFDHLNYLINIFMLFYLPCEIIFDINSITPYFLIWKLLDLGLTYKVQQNAQFCKNFDYAFICNSLSSLGVIILMSQPTQVVIIKLLLTIFVLLCTLPRIKIQELSLKLEFSSWDESFSILLPMLKLCIYIHLLTCFWYVFNKDSDENDNDYWDSLFVVTGIISFNNQTTITSKNQKLFFTFASLSALFVLAYIIHQTKELLGPLKYDISLFKQAFFRVPVPLKLQIVKYCNIPMNSANKKLILPSSITNKIAFHQGYSMLKFCFPEYEESTLNNCLDLCEQIEAQPEERLLKEGQVDDCSIYFILQGKVKIVDRHCLEVFTNKKSGECFGEYAFYTQNPRSATVISDGSCRLLKLKRMDFLGCLSWKDKQIFQFEQEQMMFSNNYKWQCYCCNSYRHTINKCPQLTYKPKRLKVQNQYAKESVIERLKVKRGRIAKHDSTWVIMNQLNLIVKRLQVLYNSSQTLNSISSNCLLLYDEQYKESNQQKLISPSLEVSQLQLSYSDQQLQNDMSVIKQKSLQQNNLTAGFGLQQQPESLVMDYQDFLKQEQPIKSNTYSYQSGSFDNIDGNQQKSKFPIRIMKSKQSSHPSTLIKSNLQSDFVPFQQIEEIRIDDCCFEYAYQFQYYQTNWNYTAIIEKININ